MSQFIAANHYISDYSTSYNRFSFQRITLRYFKNVQNYDDIKKAYNKNDNIHYNKIFIQPTHQHRKKTLNNTPHKIFQNKLNYKTKSKRNRV